MKNSVGILALCIALVGCAGTDNKSGAKYDTPTVDYIENITAEGASHQDSFLNQLAMNYRSYALYNARMSGYPDIAELFAQKAVGAFSGETPFPETLNNWQVRNESERDDLRNAYNDLVDALNANSVEKQPRLAAEAQAKFDCWLSAAASGQDSTAQECKQRFVATIQALHDCLGDGVRATKTVVSQNIVVPSPEPEERYYPETRRLSSMSGNSRARDGVLIVNNVIIPNNVIQPVPVATQTVQRSDDFVSRDEFIILMNQMREELAAINKRLDDMTAKEPVPAETMDERTVIKVQQIPLEPSQSVVEEVFEIRFDFDKATIKPEYDDIIRQLAATTQANKNVKVSVVGHTDTAGSKAYNYALGGRRAEAVQKMLISYGIPSAQIIAVSAGEEDLKVPTPDNTPNAANRRVRVVKETKTLEEPKLAPLIIEEYTESDVCEDCEM